MKLNTKNVCTQGPQGTESGVKRITVGYAQGMFVLLKTFFNPKGGVEDVEGMTLDEIRDLMKTQQMTYPKKEHQTNEYGVVIK